MAFTISFTILSSLSFFLTLIFTTTKATENFHYFCDKNNDNGNYTTNSTYNTNLNTLLSTLTSNKEINYGFYNSSYGKNTDKVNAIGLCRGDIAKSKDCQNCLNNARILLTQNCSNRKEAIGWYDDEKCMLRYSNRSIFNLVEIGPAYFVWNLNNATNEDEFNKVVKNLLDGLRSRVILGDTRVKFATASEVGAVNQTVYGLVQCTPDLSRGQCDDCLVQSIAEIPHCCDNSVGARIIRPSCSVRYETNSLFYEPTIASLSPSPTPLPSAPPPLFGQNTSSKASQSLSPSPLPSAPSPSFGQNTFSKDKGNTSKTTVTVVPLLLFLLYSFLSVSI